MADLKWRMAEALEVLRGQINTLSPNRSKASDGGIGDAAHASRSSDHNPHIADGAFYVVSARDFTHDPAHGIDSQKLADALVASRDPRIKYIISNRKIISGPAGPSPWVWRKYSGSNPHNKHVHISVRAEKAHYDSKTPWDLSKMNVPPAKAEAPKTPNTSPIIKRGSKQKAYVEEIQRALGIKVDGIFGKGTEDAVKAFQKSKKLEADGVVGVYTWAALRAKAKADAAAKKPAAVPVPEKPAPVKTPAPVVQPEVTEIVITAKDPIPSAPKKKGFWERMKDLFGI